MTSPVGCSTLAVGVLFLIAALYGIFIDRSLKSGTWLAYLFLGGSSLAIIIGALVISGQRTAARTWRGFALGPKGASRARMHAVKARSAEGVSLTPLPSPAGAKPSLAVLLMHAAGSNFDTLHLKYIAYVQGKQPLVGVNGRTARLGKLPDGNLSRAQSFLTGANSLRPIAEAAREASPGLPVTLVIAPPRAERSLKTAVAFGLIGAAIEEAFASAKDRKSRSALEEAFGGELGRDFAAFCNEYGWTLERA
ncbi:MAG: hypothetical protein ACYSX0_11120 [Planctomycetota bacterium]